MVIIIPWVLQFPTEVGHQSGTLWGKSTWANEKSFLTLPRSPLPANLAKAQASAASSCQLFAARGDHPAADSRLGLSWDWDLLLLSSVDEGKNSPLLLVKHCSKPPDPYRVSSENSRHSQIVFGWEFGFVLQILCDNPPLSSLPMPLQLLLITSLWISGNH